MYQPKQRPSIFGVASIDLFASALGAFVILTIVSLPFFMNSDKSGRLEPLMQRYSQLLSQQEILEKQVETLQQQNQQLAIEDLELLLLVDFSNSYASFLDGLEYELRTLAKFWERRDREIHLSVILYGDQKTRYPILQANIDLDDARSDLSEIYNLLRRIRSETFRDNNQSHLNQDGPEALHLALEQAQQYQWRLPPSQRLAFIHYDNLCYPQQMSQCKEDLRQLGTQVDSLFMKYTRSAISTTPELAAGLAEEGGATFIDSGQSWTLQIFNHADRQERVTN